MYTYTHPFNGHLSRTTWVSRYQKGKINLDFTEARDSERQWHQLGHMQVCTLLQTDNHANTSPLSFLQAECPSCRPTNSVKALKALHIHTHPFNGPTHTSIKIRNKMPNIQIHYIPQLMAHSLKAKSNFLCKHKQNI